MRSSRARSCLSIVYLLSSQHCLSSKRFHNKISSNSGTAKRTEPSAITYTWLHLDINKLHCSMWSLANMYYETSSLNWSSAILTVDCGSNTNSLKRVISREDIPKGNSSSNHWFSGLNSLLVSGRNKAFQKWSDQCCRGATSFKAFQTTGASGREASKYVTPLVKHKTTIRERHWRSVVLRRVIFDVIWIYLSTRTQSSPPGWHYMFWSGIF